MPTRMSSHRWDASLDRDVVSAFLGLQWAHAQSLAKMQPGLQKHGLTPAEFDLLVTLRNEVPPYELTPSQIQARMVITSGGLTKVMRQLEDRGYVHRRQHAADLRVKPVLLSADGAEAIENAMRDVVAATGAWLRKVLNEEQLAQLARVLPTLGAGSEG